MINNNKGFTIIELIVVVAILGILVFLAGPKMIKRDFLLIHQKVELRMLLQVPGSFCQTTQFNI